MKLRLLPIIITVIVSSAVMFGGWFMYQTVAMEDPLTRDVTAIEGVKDVRVELDRTLAVVHITLEEGAKLSDTYRSVEEASKAVLGNKEVSIEVAGDESKRLDSIWAQAMFDVAQAMETKEYSLIPERLNELGKANQGLKVTSEMDEHNVYITLSEGSSSKYVVLPRIPAMMGVWPNE